MHEQINAYLRRTFNLDEAGANDMRQKFWRTYGTTLNGFDFHRRTRHVDPHRCAFIDDAAESLRAAHRLGMSPVWVSSERRRAPFIDLRVASVLELPRLVFRGSSA